MCRDVSCIIIRVIENNLLGVLCINKISKEIIQCAAIAFADDTDFMTDGEEAQSQMQEMLNTCNRLHGATGGQIEETKTTYHSWQWRWKQGQKTIKNVEKELEINNIKLTQTNVQESVKTLGVHMSPTLSWIKQYEMMKEKMHKAMSKLRSTPITIANAYVYFNMYLITSVYFGCRVLTLNPKQEEELMKISEATLLRKLGLSKRFPRKILCTRKSQLGAGILKPTTIMTILSLKLYLGHLRFEDEVSKQIRVNESNAQFQYGFSDDILCTEDKQKPANKTWSDEIAQRLHTRKITVENKPPSIYITTKNKTIMDYACKYAQEKNKDPKEI